MSVNKYNRKIVNLLMALDKICVVSKVSGSCQLFTKFPRPLKKVLTGNKQLKPDSDRSST